MYREVNHVADYLANMKISYNMGVHHIIQLNDKSRNSYGTITWEWLKVECFNVDETTNLLIEKNVNAYMSVSLNSLINDFKSDFSMISFERHNQSHGIGCVPYLC